MDIWISLIYWKCPAQSCPSSVFIIIFIIIFKFLITSWYILPQVYWTTKWFPFSHYLTTLQSSVGSPTVGLCKRQLELRLPKGKGLCFGCDGEHFSKARGIWLPHGFWWPYHSGKNAVLWRIWRALDLLPKKLQRHGCPHPPTVCLEINGAMCAQFLAEGVQVMESFILLRACSGNTCCMLGLWKDLVCGCILAVSGLDHKLCRLCQLARVLWNKYWN